MKKFGFASLLLAVSLALPGCEPAATDPAPSTTDPSLPAMHTPAMPPAPADGAVTPAPGDGAVAPAPGEAVPFNGDAKAAEEGAAPAP